MSETKQKIRLYFILDSKWKNTHVTYAKPIHGNAQFSRALHQTTLYTAYASRALERAMHVAARTSYYFPMLDVMHAWK